mmetsp:Transcript_62554/g.72761  ORF Transcript_62554/g.72761 Transcript_62554/m.72761 type:complete len:506 (-) Transcript_62554:135-1652(-)
MTSSVLEQIRGNLEDVEHLEKAITSILFEKADNPRDSVINDHKIKNLIQIIQTKSAEALNLVTDTDGIKKEELAVLAGQKSANPNDPSKEADVWSNFYDKVRDIKDYYKVYEIPTTQTQPRDAEWFKSQCFEPPFTKPFFTMEESNGKFVDMHHLYQEFVNLRKINRDYKIGDYLSYLQNFDQFHDINYSLKDKEYKKYKRYLKNLADYLKEFYKRTQPLTDFNIIELQTKEDFEYRWKEGTLRGWERRDENTGDVTSNPLYCAACQKLFSNQHVYVNHFNGKKHIKNAKVYEKQLTGQNNGQENEYVSKQSELTEENKKKLAYLECFIMGMKEQLGDVIHATRNQIQKKQSRTYEEMEAENVDAKEEADEKSDSDDDEPVYNPKNLPLGWDGKPIPYWLYKLHGLGIEYKCEICGNYSYWGRRAFERHFQEWRHAYGMKCLRIPNTVHFKEITSINDALALHQKLMMEAELDHFKPEVEEEFEDSEGHVLTKKQYVDLKRQGLL